MTATDFVSLGLSEPILRALAARNYTTPTPIQARAIPYLLQGRDLLGIAQTGTGKTAAFALPMLQYLAGDRRRPMPRMPRALILAPTRELATQIADACEDYGRHLGLRVTIVFGGVGQNPQVQALRQGVDILVATPGRLLDLIKQRHCDLSTVEVLVLDEADRMLDMGFLPDVRRILSTLPKVRHSLLFSATMPQDVTALANGLLRDPVRVEVTPPATADRVAQSVYFATKAQKRDLLAELLADPVFERTLVFTRTKHGADRVVKHLRQVDIHAHAIHGNKSQNARERALDDFRSGKAHVLVATDIAARGIDVPEISHVINFDLPNIPESYVHRIGRTARAGRAGIAISFCDQEEREFLRDIEKLIRQRIPVAGQDPKLARPARPAPKAQPEPVAAATAHRGNPWFGDGIEDERSESATDDDAPPARPPAPKQRQRPEQRQAPGPYQPEPDRPHRPAPRGHGRPDRQPKHRPATPHWVDPGERRERHQEHQQRSRPQPAPQQGQRPQGGQGSPRNHGGQGGQRGQSGQGSQSGPRGHGGPKGHGGGRPQQGPRRPRR
jgi:ATP-dependent RNA helicase RhlE